MYRSTIDSRLPELSFDFDPLRPLHAHEDSRLNWREYPYKQVVIDRLCSQYSNPQLSQEAAAGALLITRNDYNKAVYEVDAYCSDVEGNGWNHLEERFRNERDAFRLAKRAHLHQQRQQVAEKLQKIEQKHQEEAEQEALNLWKKRQIIKRYENGTKYEGDGVIKNNVLVEHGMGTLWVTHELTGMEQIPRYVGLWMDGSMHGHGTYLWSNGDSWEGNFCIGEMYGKGIYTYSGEHSDDGVDSSRPKTPKVQRVRYYEASQHVCWGDDLVPGIRLRLYSNRHYGNPLSTIVKRHNVDLEEETECVIIRHDSIFDKYFVRKDGTENTWWISLKNISFQIVQSQPITRLEGV